MLSVLLPQMVAKVYYSEDLLSLYLLTGCAGPCRDVDCARLHPGLHCQQLEVGHVPRHSQKGLQEEGPSC